MTVRFLGLFDTVAGIINIRDGDFAPSNDRNAPIDLYLDPATVSTAVQLTAIDECRENFALNSLRYPDDTLPNNFREIALPGAHSDIGGGYHNNQTEQLLLHPKLTIKGNATAWPEQTMQWDNLTTLKMTADAEGWVGAQSLPLQGGEPASLSIHKDLREHPTPNGQVVLWISNRPDNAIEVGRFQANEIEGDTSKYQVRTEEYLERSGDYISQHGIPTDGW